MTSLGSYAYRFEPGTGDTLVVSIAGIGRPDVDAMAWEFESTLRSLGRPHCVYVQDRSRSWFNQPLGFEALVEALRDVRRQVGAERLVTLGLSMGGFGAILLGSILEADAVVAMAPQSAIDPALTARHDERWNYLLSGVRGFPRGDVSTLRPKGRMHVLVGDEDPRDLWQAGRIRLAGDDHCYLFRGGRHNLGESMKSDGHLAPVLGSLVLGRADAFAEELLAQRRVTSPETLSSPGAPRPSVRPPEKGMRDWSFGRGGSGTDLLGRGWYGAEAWGAWSGTLSELRLPLVDALRADAGKRVVELTLMGGPRAGNASTTVSVSLANAPVAAWVVPPGHPSTHVFAFEPDAAREGAPPLVLRFECADAVSPRDLGLGPDARPLGIGLIRMRILSPA